MEYKTFFEHILEDKELMEIFSNFNSEYLDKLNADERIDIYRKIVDRFNTFYPEFGKYNINFFISNDVGGEAKSDGFYINAQEAYSNMYFHVLGACVHEFRHFYQNSAIRFMNHPMFSEDDIISFEQNWKHCVLSDENSYFYISSLNYYEYYVQPVELDAYSFEKEFCIFFSNHFLKNEEDKEKIKQVYGKFDRIIKYVDQYKDEIVDFNKVYYDNIRKRINKIRDEIGNERILLKEQKDKIKNISTLNRNELYSLFSPASWKRVFDYNEKKKIIDQFMIEHNFYIDYEMNEDVFKCQNVSFNSSDSFAILECLLKVMAAKRIEDIFNKPESSLTDEEKLIVLNGKNPDNFIKKEKSPLFYEIQPLCLYRNTCISKMFQNIFNSIKQISSVEGYFEKYSYYTNKYDVGMMKRKVELITGKKFNKVYKEITDKMKKTTSR